MEVKLSVVIGVNPRYQNSQSWSDGSARQEIRPLLLQMALPGRSLRGHRRTLGRNDPRICAQNEGSVRQVNFRHSGSDACGRSSLGVGLASVGTGELSNF